MRHKIIFAALAFLLLVQSASAQTLLQNMTSQFTSMIGIDWTLLFAGMIYLIVIGIILFAKISFDGVVVILTLTTSIVGTWMFNIPLFIMIPIGIGIIVGIAVLRLVRH